MIAQNKLDELKFIWSYLDSTLKDCAKQSFEFGTRNQILRLNEIGMSQLIQHLDKYGFEIKKKE
jgi:hypothetical protein